ncbi:tetratricopeptide repeat protein [Spirulina sp. CS-785/01]|uniref:tetratricopeptide repeat protein n=1 Tax=Spirulina sp. CS-785/01 TaxID=3021716 RepID=UPI00232ED3A5|nr:tetratricopeptide repeat protein [Spirulina sp. CS-785/01]MDB9314830.1 tetratricopeptide repeat protein [Spirulina sp. CS-785/01]
MTKSQVSPTSELQSAIDRYSHALDSVEKKSPQPSESEILEVLLARDEVKSTLEGITDAETQQVETLIKLDDRLNKQARVIARCGNLPDWRKSVKPDDSAWWWFFQTRKKVNQWDRMDWLWNLLSAGCLAITASLFITIFRSLAVGGGITWQQSFAGIAQGTGLIVLAQSSLTSKGQERVQNLLRNLGIPDYLYSEATFSASLVLLLISGAAYYQMPGWLKEKGQENYHMGNLSQAEKRYLQALNLDPENASINLRLGEVYELGATAPRSIRQGERREG